MISGSGETHLIFDNGTCLFTSSSFFVLSIVLGDRFRILDKLSCEDRYSTVFDEDKLSLGRRDN